MKVLNVTKLKHFFENIEKYKDEEGDTRKLFNQKSDQAPEDFKDIFNQAPTSGPITRLQAR